MVHSHRVFVEIYVLGSTRRKFSLVLTMHGYKLCVGYRKKNLCNSSLIDFRMTIVLSVLCAMVFTLSLINNDCAVCHKGSMHLISAYRIVPLSTHGCMQLKHQKLRVGGDT